MLPDSDANIVNVAKKIQLLISAPRIKNCLLSNILVMIYTRIIMFQVVSIFWFP